MSLITVKRVESSDKPFSSRTETLARLRSTLETAGVAFPEDADGFRHRVQLRTAPRK